MADPAGSVAGECPVSETNATVTNTDNGQEYRALSGLAVTSLVAGVLSPAALGSIMFVVIPATAVVTGLAALRQISRGDTLTGRTMAKWGLNLGLAFLLVAIGYEVLRYVAERSVVIETTRQFASLAGQGRADEATRLLLLKPKPRRLNSRLNAWTTSSSSPKCRIGFNCFALSSERTSLRT